MRAAHKALIGSATLALLCLAALLPALAAAAPTAVWKLSATSQPTNFIPGSNGAGVYLLLATNVGAKATEGEIVFTDTLPTGLSPAPGAAAGTNDSATADFSCATAAQTVTCKSPGPLNPGYTATAEIPVNVTAPEGSVLINKAEVSGGAASAAKAGTPTTISNTEPLFDFLAGEEGLRAPIIDEEGAPATAAGTHAAYEAIADVGFPTVELGGFLTGSGHLRDLSVDFPPGMLANPAATPALCTEAQLTSESNPGCPPGSQVGTVTITTVAIAAVGPKTSPLFNMVPPPGAPAAFGFNALGVGIFAHVTASIRTDSDYGASGHSNDILARGLNPILNASVELWGDPSGKEHDQVRGKCIFGAPRPCAVEPQPDTFLALPGNCPEEPLLYGAFADSWEEPFPAFEEREAFYESADLEGNPTQIEGCNELDFEPTITAKPTTNVTDSPSGLNVDLHQPQDFTLEGRSTAALRDATVTLPLGLAVNASQANGLKACDSAQIGMLTEVGESPASFSAEPADCPDASKVGTVAITSPLLAEYDEENKVERDPENGEVIPRPLHGSVYVAKPFDNPFDSLLAIYLTVEDPKTGIFAKLAGEVEPDPLSGQLRTRFEENPELPLQNAKISLFEGDRAPLQTPPSCGEFTTDAHFVPWSAPQAPEVDTTDTFTTTATPLGGPCPSSAAGAPNTISFTAGTLTPQAGAFSPLVAKLSRPSGSQRMAKLETTMPPGLTGKLAGIGQCSEAQIAQAQSRNQPGQGATELASPSCPAGSSVGILDVGAGAGPNPFRIQGRLYLAGPYKGAPLSLITITPAVAGPFDLGVVAVRVALYLDSTTAQVRAVSDPFPQILQGIPVDVRSVAVSANRPGFTLNPTNCNPLAFGGSVTSIFGATAPLTDPFQVGGCDALPFGPKLQAKLFGPIHRGGHPRLRAILTAKPGEANIARTVVALPRSEFLDQGHIRTICTRVQFAANQCPPGSIYGHAKATTPLLDYVVEGPIYLRSSSNELPDIVAALRGPPSQPVAIDLVGRVDSIKGGIRTSFEAVPDQPVTKAIITMQGAKKGLLQNSTNICKGTHRLKVRMTGQNGKPFSSQPPLKAQCGKKGRKGKG